MDQGSSLALLYNTASMMGILLAIGNGVNAAEPSWHLEGAQKRIRDHRMSDAVVELVLGDGTPVSKGRLVQVKQTGHAFFFGGSLTQVWTLHKHPEFQQYLERFEALFNYATVGFYWNWHERREPGTWKLRNHTGEMIKWSKERGITVKGHPMMWHNSLPVFVEGEQDVKRIDRYILDHVRMLAKDYPQVDQWDLYNEAPGIRLKPDDHGAKRWMTAMGGAGPITKRLMDTVRKVQPKGFFMLNHFRHDDPEYHEQISWCVKNNVQFDAIGIQTHMHKQGSMMSEKQVWEMLEEYAGYDKSIHLSEVSVLSSELFKDWRELQKFEAEIGAARKARKEPPFRTSTPEGEKFQAQYVRDFYTLAFSHPAVESIVWWSVTDQGAWRGSAAGLLDRNMKPKPVYKELDQLINNEWRTSVKVKTDEEGHISVRGFHGGYSVTVLHEGRQIKGSFRLERGKPCRVRVTMDSGNG